MIPLLLPWLVLLLVLSALLLAIKKKWLAVVLFFLLALMVNWQSECIPLRLRSILEKERFHNIRVMTFNINSTKESIVDKVSKLSHLIVKESPDIVFLSELSYANKPYLDSILVKHYPYHRMYDWHCFYSKYPLSKKIELKNNHNEAIGVFKYKAIIGTDTLILYGCHFASNNYSSNADYITPDSIKSRNKLIQYLYDIELAYSIREKEAMALCDDIPTSFEKIIVLGDFNDVGGSTTIGLLEDAGLKDVWWCGGVGYGATIHKPLPYRIDHILYSNQFKLNRVKVVGSDELSDHDAVFAEFSY